MLERNIKLIIEYDGTNFSGWQIQNNIRTVQKVIQEVIKKLTGEEVNLMGCSRTDAGVHAKMYVANFKTTSKIPAEKFKYAMNNKLPMDIVIIKSEQVDLKFHSRFYSKGKKYTYTILNREDRPTINRNNVYHFNKKLDIDLMREASKYFIGTHEFDSFYRKKGSSIKTTIRTIHEVDIYSQDDTIKFVISGNGFLYNMVRIMIGTLLQVGVGKIHPKDIESILLAKNRKLAGPCLQPQGLSLTEVFY